MVRKDGGERIEEVWVGAGLPAAAFALIAAVVGGATACSAPGSGSNAGAPDERLNAGSAAGGSHAAAGAATSGSNASSGSRANDAGGAASSGSGADAHEAGGGTSDAGGSDSGFELPAAADLGPAELRDDELDPPSSGATITFQDVGGTGWYPSRRDPSTGDCSVRDDAECCMTQHSIDSDRLTPWNEELGMTLRGPLRVKQIAVYRLGSATAWERVSAWDSRGTTQGIAFWGSGAQAGFDGRIGNVCEAEVATDRAFPCGPGSVPYCTEGGDRYYGWEGSKLFVVLATSPHYGSSDLDERACEGPGHGWHDAPWLGLSHGELVRSGRYSGCHCWSKPGNPYAQDGCGQFNVFEVVNDNNRYANLELFSTNLVSYAGYIGEGPCGDQCDASALPASADLLDKRSGNTAASAGAIASPSAGPRAAFVRPDHGYRYFVTLLDVDSRTVQVALIHPRAIPTSIAKLLPALPERLDPATIAALLELRLPR